MTFTLTDGGDHEGADWTPDDAAVISGTHYNIGTFTVTNGYTVTINTGYPLEVHALTATITGTINGNGKGYSGGAVGGCGSGPGRGGGGLTNVKSAAGGGYGGNGGGLVGTICDAGIKGISNGSSSVISLDMGSGGGGGGSGGGIMIIGCIVVVSGNITANGADGNHIHTAVQGGGGGRIKIFYRTYDSSGSTITATEGNGGAIVGTTHTDEIAQCTSALSFGQSFTPGNDVSMALKGVTIYVNSVATSGDFTCTLYDDTAKTSTLDSKTITISSTGENSFEFDSYVRIEDGSTELYVEIVADAGGDIDLGIYSVNNTSGSLYWNGDEVEYFDSYHKIDIVAPNKNVEVYNIANSSVKCAIANEILTGEVVRINTDGTGTIVYNDDFSTEKWIIDYKTMLNVTHDTGNDELDIADDGYLTYRIDCKYPITGIPTLTSQINITAGTPTIQISEDGSTWYDITSAIVDDVDTIYELDSSSLSLKGKTIFYYRYDCVKATTATCSIKSFELDVNIVTIDVEHPKITTGATASTFRCDQDTTSAMDCEISLIYRDRSWPV